MNNFPNRGATTKVKQTFGNLSLTIPGKGLKVREAIERYRAGTLEERTLGYYYDAYDIQGEEEIPNFNMMTRIDKLQLLAEKKEQVKRLKQQIQDGTITEEQATTTQQPDPLGE